MSTVFSTEVPLQHSAIMNMVIYLFIYLTFITTITSLIRFSFKDIEFSDIKYDWPCTTKIISLVAAFNNKNEKTTLSYSESTNLRALRANVLNVLYMLNVLFAI